MVDIFCFLFASEVVKLLSCVWLFATPWTVACQVPPSMGFSRQEYWSGLPFPSPGDLPNPGIEPGSAALQADALPSKPLGKPPCLQKIHLFQSQRYSSMFSSKNFTYLFILASDLQTF